MTARWDTMSMSKQVHQSEPHFCYSPSHRSGNLPMHCGECSTSNICVPHRTTAEGPRPRSRYPHTQETGPKANFPVVVSPSTEKQYQSQLNGVFSPPGSKQGVFSSHLRVPYLLCPSNVFKSAEATCHVTEVWVPLKTG